MNSQIEIIGALHRFAMEVDKHLIRCEMPGQVNPIILLLGKKVKHLIPPICSITDKILQRCEGLIHEHHRQLQANRKLDTDWKDAATYCIAEFFMIRDGQFPISPISRLLSCLNHYKGTIRQVAKSSGSESIEAEFCDLFLPKEFINSMEDFREMQKRYHDSTTHNQEFSQGNFLIVTGHPRDFRAIARRMVFFRQIEIERGSPSTHSTFQGPQPDVSVSNMEDTRLFEDLISKKFDISQRQFAIFMQGDFVLDSKVACAYVVLLPMNGCEQARRYFIKASAREWRWLETIVSGIAEKNSGNSNVQCGDAAISDSIHFFIPSDSEKDRSEDNIRIFTVNCMDTAGNTRRDSSHGLPHSGLESRKTADRHPAGENKKTGSRYRIHRGPIISGVGKSDILSCKVSNKDILEKALSDSIGFEMEALGCCLALKDIQDIDLCHIDSVPIRIIKSLYDHALESESDLQAMCAEIAAEATHEYLFDSAMHPSLFNFKSIEDTPVTND